MEPEIYNYMLSEPKSRAIRNRMRAIVNLLLKQFPELAEIPKDKLIDFLRSAESYNRIFRKVLSEHPELVPEEDKGDVKRILEEQKELELGYEPRYFQDTKRLNML